MAVNIRTKVNAPHMHVEGVSVSDLLARVAALEAALAALTARVAALESP